MTRQLVGCCSIAWLIAISGCASLNMWKQNDCRVGPNYAGTTAWVGRQWYENSPSLINDSHAVDDLSWWRAFHDPEIDRLVQTAVCQNLPLKVAFDRIQEQRLQRAIDQGNLWPQQQAAFAEFQRVQFSKTGNQFGILGQGNPFSLYRVGFNANWEIDVWGRLRRIVEASDATLQATQEDYCDVKLCLVADVVTAYTEIRLAQARLHLANQQAEAQRDTLEIAISKYNEGDVSQLDVFQARATLDNTLASIPALKNSLTQASHRLTLLLGIPPQPIYQDYVAPIPTAPEAVVIGMPRDLVRRRPDVRAAERRLAAQCARIGVAQADLYPALRLRGTIGFDSFRLEDLIDGNSVNGAIIPGLQWNILNYGRIQNNISLQRTQFDRLTHSYLQTVLSANTEAANALSAYTRKQDEVKHIRDATEQTRRALEVAQTQYREGEIEFDTLNSLRKDLIRQSDELTLKQGESTLELIRLYKVMGGGWTIPETAIEYGRPIPLPSIGLRQQPSISIAQRPPSD